MPTRIILTLEILSIMRYQKWWNVELNNLVILYMNALIVIIFIFNIIPANLNFVLLVVINILKNVLFLLHLNFTIVIIDILFLQFMTLYGIFFASIEIDLTYYLKLLISHFLLGLKKSMVNMVLNQDLFWFYILLEEMINGIRIFML